MNSILTGTERTGIEVKTIKLKQKKTKELKQEPDWITRAFAEKTTLPEIKQKTEQVVPLFANFVASKML